MRLLTHKDGDLPTYFDAIDEKRGADANFSLKPKLFGNHANDYNKGRKRTSTSRTYFWDLKSFKNKKMKKRLGFELQLKISTWKRDSISTTIGGKAIIETINNLFLYNPLPCILYENNWRSTIPLVKGLHYHLFHGLLIENSSKQAMNINQM